MDEITSWFNTNQGLAEVILSSMAMIVSIIFGSISVYKSRKAKKSEAKAAKYAHNADEHNKAAKDYYVKMNEKIESDELQRRIENVYMPLWEQVQETRDYLLKDTGYIIFRLDNSLSSYGAPTLDVIYIVEHLKSAQALIEKTSLNEDIKVLIDRIEDYNTACNYAAQEIEMVYSNVLARHADEFIKRYNCKIKISHSSTLNDLFVLFEALCNDHFYINYLDSSNSEIEEKFKSRFLSELSVNSFEIKEETIKSINAYNHLLEKIIDVKNGFIDIEGKLKSIIQYGINEEESNSEEK